MKYSLETRHTMQDVAQLVCTFTADMFNTYCRGAPMPVDHGFPFISHICNSKIEPIIYIDTNSIYLNYPVYYTICIMFYGHF